MSCLFTGRVLCTGPSRTWPLPGIYFKLVKLGCHCTGPQASAHTCSLCSPYCWKVGDWHLNGMPSILVTVCKRSLQRLCFYTCLSFCSQGGGLPQCMLGYHPPSRPHRSRHPPPLGSRHPRGADTPESRHPPGADPPPRE